MMNSETKAGAVPANAPFLVLISVAGLVWYVAVEWMYFSVQGPRFRRTFASVNGKTVDAYSYRSPWLATVVYIILVIAYVFLAILPALDISLDRCVLSGKQGNADSFCNRFIAVSSPGEAYVRCLWRAIILSLAVYGTYDLTTHVTVNAFSGSQVIIDLLYGAVILPAIVIAPVAAILASALSPPY